MIPITIDGHTYTKADIQAMREEVIVWRDNSMDQWPDAIPFTTAATHLIGVLSHIVDQYPEA